MKTNERIMWGKYARLNQWVKMGVVVPILLASCDLNNEAVPDTSPEDQETNTTIQMDALEDYYFEDTDDLAALAMDEEGGYGARTTTDERLSCAVITHTGSDEEGTIRIDFGTGCTDGRNQIRRGSILIDYRGRPSASGSFRSITFDNYFINEVQLTGTRTVTNITTDANVPSFEIRLTGGSANWPDGTVARREVERRRHHERNTSNLLDRLIVYGTEEGNHRNGRGFFIDILEPLVYDRTCAEEGVFIPVEGKKLIQHGDREITVDYGDGACDNAVTITNKNGRSWDYRVN